MRLENCGFCLLLVISVSLGDNAIQDDLSHVSSSLRSFLVSVGKNATSSQPELGLSSPIDPLFALAPLRYLHEGDLLKLKLLLTNVTLVGLSSLAVQEVTISKKKSKTLNELNPTTTETSYRKFDSDRRPYEYQEPGPENDKDDEYDYKYKEPHKVDDYDFNNDEYNMDDEDYLGSSKLEGSGYQSSDEFDKVIDNYPDVNIDTENFSSFEKLFLKDYETFVRKENMNRHKRSVVRDQKAHKHHRSAHDRDQFLSEKIYQHRKLRRGKKSAGRKSKSHVKNLNSSMTSKRVMHFFNVNLRVTFVNLKIKAQYVIKGRAGGVFTFKEQGKLVLSIPNIFLTSTFNATVVQDLTGLRHLNAQNRRNHVKVQKVRSRMSFETPKLELIPVSRPAEWVRKQLQEKMDELGRGVGRRDGAIRLLLRHWAKLLRRLVSKSI